MTNPQNAQTISVESLGKPIHVIRDNLEDIFTKSCYLLANELQNWLNTSRLEVSLNYIVMHSLSAAETADVTFSTLKHEEGGMLHLHMNNSLLVKLADRFYGASVERDDETLTNSDLRLQERIAKLISQWVAPQEMWQVNEFELGLGMGLRIELTLAYQDESYQLVIDLDGKMIETLINQLSLQPSSDLTEKFKQSLTATPVFLNVLLSKTTMPLTEVLNLSANDIIPIELLSSVPVSIGNEKLFSGHVAEQEGQLVVILNNIEDNLR